MAGIAWQENVLKRGLDWSVIMESFPSGLTESDDENRK